MFDKIKFTRLQRPVQVFGCAAAITVAFATTTAIAQPTMLPALVISTGQLPEQLTLVLDLGADSFEQRQWAGGQLLAHPGKSHDWLYRAQNSSAPEISNAARQLRSRICLDGLLTEVSPELSMYVNGDLFERQRSIARFGRTNSTAATRALLTIVKFETHELLSQIATVTLIENAQDREAVRQAVAVSPREGADWLRIWFADSDRKQFVTRWQPIIAELASAQPAAECAPLYDHAAILLKLTAERYWSLGELEKAAGLVRYLGDSCHAEPLRLIELFDWLVFQQQYQHADQLTQSHVDQFHSQPRLLIRLAELSKIKGRLRQSESFADQAWRQLSEDPLQVIEVSIHLRDTGLEQWAIRLLEKSLCKSEPLDASGIAVCRILAQIYDQRQDYFRAATVLELAIDKFPEDPDSDQNENELPAALVAQSSYYWHLHYAMTGQWDAAQQQLLIGLQAMPGHSQLLIAASQFDGQGADWTPAIGELIQIALELRQQQIQFLQTRITDDPREKYSIRHRLAAELNGWAWLAAQAGVELPQAEQYARQALAINPVDARVLDTLAACCYARGKHREAVALQLEAIELAPYHASLQTGLHRYRQAQAATAAWPGIFR